MATRRAAVERPAPTDAPDQATTPLELASALSALATALATRNQTPPAEQATTNLELAVLCQQLEHTAFALTHYFVNQARNDGTTWDDIGKAFGVTRQSVYTRFGKGSPIDRRYAGRRGSG